MRRYTYALLGTLLAAASSCAAQSLDDLNIQFHGYATQGFLYTTNNNILTTTSSNGSPDWTEAVVNLSAQPTPKLRLSVHARSKSDLKEIFTGNSTNLGGSRVTPVLLKSGAVSDEFLAAYVGKTDIVFRAGWRSLVFAGEATMPKSLDSDAAVVEYVAKTPGALGYIAKSSPHEGVKVIAIH